MTSLRLSATMKATAIIQHMIEVVSTVNRIHVCAMLRAVQEAPVRIGLIEVKISMEAIVAYSTEMAGGAFQENFKIVTICSSSSPSSLFSERSNIFDAVQARDVPL